MGFFARTEDSMDIHELGPSVVSAWHPVGDQFSSAHGNSEVDTTAKQPLCTVVGRLSMIEHRYLRDISEYVGRFWVTQ